jgi:hypothetical protein
MKFSDFCGYISPGEYEDKGPNSEERKLRRAACRAKDAKRKAAADEAVAKQNAFDALSQAEKEAQIAEKEAIIAARKEQEAEAKAARELHEKIYISLEEARTYQGGFHLWKSLENKSSVLRADFVRELPKAEADAKAKEIEVYKAWLVRIARADAKAEARAKLEADI